MGANAQTTVPTFTAGQVLTADQQNQSARTGVPVFADTTARDAAFGGTGEKTLAEGQLCYVENLTGDAQIQYYDGSTWNSLGAAGLTLISSTTIGSSVSSVTVSNAFSSTYDNYMILVSGGVGGGTSNIGIDLGASNTGYWAVYTLRQFGTNTTTLDRTDNGVRYPYAASCSTNNLYGLIYVSAPNLAKTTSFTSFAVEHSTTAYSIWGQGFLNDTTQYTGFTLTPNATTLTGGTIKVYGFRN